MITPGVPLMERIASSLEGYCAIRLGQTEGLAGADAVPQWPKGLRATVSGSSCIGEGEHKILTAVLQNEASDRAAVQDERQDSATVHAVVGSDSDLLVMPLGPEQSPRRLLVVSDNVGGMTVRDDSGCKVRALQVCNVEVLRSGILRQHENPHGFAPTSSLGAVASTLAEAFASSLSNPVPPDKAELVLRRDFIVILLFRGNDYLPPLISSQNPEDLWKQYLKWRRAKSPTRGLICLEVERTETTKDCSDHSDSAKSLAIHKECFIDFMRSLGTSWTPSGQGGAEEAAKGVKLYLSGLLWCLETYTSGTCPDFCYRFPTILSAYASAPLIAEHAAELEPASFASTHKPSQPLLPVACAIAVLPLADVQTMLLPLVPGLASIFEPPHGLLAEVARFETCKECASLASAAEGPPYAGKKAEKRRKALEVHRRRHSDIESVPLDALDAEVLKLCRDSANAAALAMSFRDEVIIDVATIASRKRALPDGETVPSKHFCSRGEAVDEPQCSGTSIEAGDQAAIREDREMVTTEKTDEGNEHGQVVDEQECSGTSIKAGDQAATCEDEEMVTTEKTDEGTELDAEEERTICAPGADEPEGQQELAGSKKRKKRKGKRK